MKINLSPTRMDDQLFASVEGKVLTLNGETHNLESLQEGDVLTSEDIGSKWLLYATLNGGQLEVTVTLPYGSGAPESTRFPSPLLVFIDGPIDLPSYNAVE